MVLAGTPPDLMLMDPRLVNNDQLVIIAIIPILNCWANPTTMPNV
jgi:hypothetical protein